MRLHRKGSRIDPDRPGSGKTASLVASAAKVTRADLARNAKTRQNTAWQADAWRQYDICGELGYGASWVANSLSRVKLFVAVGDTDLPEPERATAGPAADYLAALFSGPAGQSEMLRAFGLHLTVPGEVYLVNYTDPGTKDVQWVTASTEELIRRGEKLILDRGDGVQITLSETSDYMLRVWRSHPRRWWLADSPTRHVMPVLVELEALSKGVLATIDSRLAGAGLLLLPEELSFPAAQSSALQHDDPLMASLIEAMITPLQDRDSAAAVVPLVMRGPGEILDKAKLLQFGQNLDQTTTPMREAALKRLAIGLDMPPEVLLGFGASNHWSAWQISEEAVKLNIEPLVATICDALTVGYLWPLLGPGEHPETIWYDTAGLSQRPDRGPDAEAVYAAGELSRVAYLRERGFGEADAPDKAERRERILLELVRAQPALAGDILPLLGLLEEGELNTTPPPPVIVESQRVDDQDGGDEEDSGEPKALPAAPDQDTMPAASSTSAFSLSMLLACDLAVSRALELAGKRMLDRSVRTRYRDVPAWLMHTHINVPTTRCDEVLDGAWTMFRLVTPELAYLEPDLDSYVRTLLVKGVAHERQWLADVLRSAVTARAVPA